MSGKRRCSSKVRGRKRCSSKVRGRKRSASKVRTRYFSRNSFIPSLEQNDYFLQTEHPRSSRLSLDIHNTPPLTPPPKESKNLTRKSSRRANSNSVEIIGIGVSVDSSASPEKSHKHTQRLQKNTANLNIIDEQKLENDYLAYLLLQSEQSNSDSGSISNPIIVPSGKDSNSSPSPPPPPPPPPPTPTLLPDKKLIELTRKEAKSEENSCCICEYEKTVVMIPCGHMCMCVVCCINPKLQNEYQQINCPECRCVVERCTYVYK